MRLGNTTVEQSMAPEARGGAGGVSACTVCDGVIERRLRCLNWDGEARHQCTAHAFLVNTSVIICIWNQQDDVGIIPKSGEEDPNIAYNLSEQNAQHQVASSQ